MRDALLMLVFILLIIKELAYSTCKPAHRIPYPADGSKIVLQMTRELLLTFAQLNSRYRSGNWTLVAITNA